MSLILLFIKRLMGIAGPYVPPVAATPTEFLTVGARSEYLTVAERQENLTVVTRSEALTVEARD